MVETDAGLRRILVELLQANGYQVDSCSDSPQAIRILQREPVDAVLTEKSGPGLDGEDLLRWVRHAHPAVPVLILASAGSIESAVRLMRAGAAYYLAKPLQTPILLESLRRVLEETRSRRLRARQAEHRGEPRAEMIARSPPMLRLLDSIRRMATSPAPVVITGETGVGKELVARDLHRASGLDAFVPLNCGAIPENLLESELFGHVRGAFTGAERDKPGLLQVAHDGTLFLDEIAELPLGLQAKLLRVLQSGELRRVGETEPRHVRVRIIAATHRDLAERVREGSFRADLYYRIHVLRLHVPSLRERRSDLPFLVEHYLAHLAVREQRPGWRVTSRALWALQAYAWPGNVRELQNVLERVSLMSERREIDLEDLPSEIRAAAASEAAAPGGRTLEEMEREHIAAVLEQTGGNRSQAAKVLGIPRRTLYRRLEEYGIGEEQG